MTNHCLLKLMSPRLSCMHKMFHSVIEKERTGRREETQVSARRPASLSCANGSWRGRFVLYEGGGNVVRGISVLEDKCARLFSRNVTRKVQGKS